MQAVQRCVDRDAHGSVLSDMPLRVELSVREVSRGLFEALVTIVRTEPGRPNLVTRRRSTLSSGSAVSDFVSAEVSAFAALGLGVSTVRWVRTEGPYFPSLLMQLA